MVNKLTNRSLVTAFFPFPHNINSKYCFSKLLRSISPYHPAEWSYFICLYQLDLLFAVCILFPDMLADFLLICSQVHTPVYSVDSETCSHISSPQYLGEQFPNSKKSPVEAFCNHPVLALLRSHWSVFHPSSFASFQICHINETKLRMACCVLLLSRNKLYLLGDSVPSYLTITFPWLSQLSPLFSFSLSIFLPSIPDSGCISHSDCFSLYLVLRLVFAVDLLCCDHTQLPDQSSTKSPISSHLPAPAPSKVSHWLQETLQTHTGIQSQSSLVPNFLSSLSGSKLKNHSININPTPSSNLA